MDGIEVMFLSGARWRFAAGGVKFARLGQQIDEEYAPDIRDGAVINWDNVMMVRRCELPEEEDDE